MISRQQPTFTPIFKMRLVIINESKAGVKNFAKPGDATLSDFGGRTLELQASFISNPPKRFPIRKSQKLIKAIVIIQNAPSFSKLIGEKLNKI